MYLTPTNKHWVFDVEALCEKTVLGLDPKEIWCVCVQNPITKEKLRFVSDVEFSEWCSEQLRNGAVFVGHNCIEFDVPACNHLAGTRIPVNRVVDTFVLSMLYSPSLAGGHSVEAWAERFGKKKSEFADFSQFSEELVERCEQDVEIQTELFLKLTARMREVGFTEHGCELEHKMWRIIRKQRANGFHFDQPRAHALFAELRGIERELQEKIYERFPPKLERVAEFKRAYRKDGSFNSQYERHLQQFPKLEIQGEGYVAYDWVEFKLGSPKQRVEKLLELGWKPATDEYTPVTEKGGGGNPQPTKKGELVPSLKKFAEEAGIVEVKLIADWMTFNSRANMIGTWLDAYNEKTRAIHGSLWMANTLRYRHDKPNTANIPAVKTTKDKTGEKVPVLGREGYFTYEARDLWVTRDPINRSLVGVDATGIQFRILAHYLNDEEFTNVVLSGDIHEYNRKKTGVGDRDQNKTFGYAALLGAGAAKTGSIFGVSTKEGANIKNTWIKTIPGLDKLYERLENELARTGRITLCDGSRVLVPSPHMVLAYLLQGDESRIMKQAAILVDEAVRGEKLDVLKVGDIHDEWQNDVENSFIELFITICSKAFEQTRNIFNYRVPLTCEAKIGKTWAETH